VRVIFNNSVTNMEDIPLADFIDKEGIEVLNTSPHTSGYDVLAGAQGRIYSDPDVDQQLMIRIPFTERVSLSGFRILATKKPEVKECDEAQPPCKVKLFKNKTNMDFDECDEKEPTQEFKMSKDQANGMPIAVNRPRFSNISSLTLFVESNQDDSPVTFLNQITFKGRAVSGRDIAEYKKNLQEAVCVQIQDGLWLGNDVAASDKVLLQDHKITHCLGTTLEKIDYWDQLKVKTFPITDVPESPIYKIFEETREFIINALSDETGGNNVLVHCTAAISRSVTIICAYLIVTKKMTANEALKCVRSKRPVANPNIGFWKQLRVLQEDLLKLSID